ncbi:MAG: nitroreductase family protein, partial [Limnobacter sp.]|nr:nitroreductase family protein [Limnobacter sp.]
MHVQDALKARHSTRSFSDKQVPHDLLQTILDQAALSPSWSNTHPYKIAIAQGEVIEDLRVTLYERYLRAAKLQRAGKVKQLQALLTRDPGIPDGDVKPVLKYPKELQQRRFECGMGLYETLGIGRKDYKAREKQMAENFRFFGAPVAVFVFIHKDVGVYSALDAGIFMQSLMLAATEQGLGSCAQGALGLY